MTKTLTSIALVSSALAITACGIRESSIKDAALEQITQRLNDPGSAQYRNVQYRHVEGRGHVVCGEMNAKNGMGGYAGFRPFVVYQRKTDPKHSDFEPKDELKIIVEKAPVCEEAFERLEANARTLQLAARFRDQFDPAGDEYKKLEEGMNSMRDRDDI